MAAYKVLIPQKIAEEGISYLRERGYEIKMGSGISLDEFKNEIEKLFLHIKDTPKLPGFEEIFIPGEIEYYTKIKNLREGIFLEDKTWSEIIELSKNLKIDVKDVVIHSEA
jgi:LDH2 family malate/lactate/ureidoglycolate dehydrogenase